MIDWWRNVNFFNWLLDVLILGSYYSNLTKETRIDYRPWIITSEPTNQVR